MNSPKPASRVDRRHARTRPVLCALLACWLLAATACALPSSLESGDRLDDTRQRLGAPAIEHATPDGGRRLLYPVGLQTYALEFDPQGRLLRSENVRDEAHFARIAAGMSREQVRLQLGEPSRVWAVRYRDQTVWSYSFEGPFCLQFHVGLTPQGVVDDTSYGPDPRCERQHFFPF